MAMAYGVTAVVLPLNPFLTGVSGYSFDIVGVISIIVGVIGFGLGLAWITIIAPITGGIGMIHRPLRSLKNTPNDTQVTSLFIKLLGFYRENHAKVRTMVLFGKIGGLIFILAGVSDAIASFSHFAYQDGVGGIILIVLGSICIRLTRYFSVFAFLWDQRIAEGKLTEDALTQTLEGRTT